MRVLVSCMCFMIVFFFFKQKTAYEMRISDWSSDVCSSDLAYARDRNVFGRPIGQNQGVQFPIARAYIQVSAASEMVDKAARMFDEGFNCEIGRASCRERVCQYV